MIYDIVTVAENRTLMLTVICKSPYTVKTTKKSLNLDQFLCCKCIK